MKTEKINEVKAIIKNIDNSYSEILKLFDSIGLTSDWWRLTPTNHNYFTDCMRAHDLESMEIIIEKCLADILKTDYWPTSYRRKFNCLKNEVAKRRSDPKEYYSNNFWHQLRTIPLLMQKVEIAINDYNFNLDKYKDSSIGKLKLSNRKLKALKKLVLEKCAYSIAFIDDYHHLRSMAIRDENCALLLSYRMGLQNLYWPKTIKTRWGNIQLKLEKCSAYAIKMNELYQDPFSMKLKAIINNIIDEVSKL